MSNLPTMTLEERVASLEKARAARAVHSAERRASTLRMDFADQQHWSDLARELKLRLPPWGIPCTVSRMRTFLHKCNLSQLAYERYYDKLSSFAKNNPDWPLRAWAGLVLEMITEIKTRKETVNV